MRPLFCKNAKGLQMERFSDKMKENRIKENYDDLHNFSR